MSFVSNDPGLEDPSSQEFIHRPDLRTISAFFLGWTFIACLRYLTLAVFCHPFTAHLLKATLRKPILVATPEREVKVQDLEGNYLQNWLRNTLQGSAKSQTDGPEGTRHLSVILTVGFALATFMSFLSLLDFRGANQGVLCIIVIAWAGISVSCAKLAGLLQITFDLQRLGAGLIERVVSWIVLALSFGATLAHAIISIGATKDVSQIPHLSLCYRRHFLATSLTVSLLNILLELYFAGRTFFLLVPPFLQFHHKVEVMMDIRVARVASILVLELLTLLPSALSVNIAAEFIPFSLGMLLVLAAFNRHPPKPAETPSFQISASHRTSVVTFPQNNDPDDHTVASDNEPQVKVDKPDSELSHSRKTSLASEYGRRRHTLRKSRDMSRAGHVSYDSEAEARSVCGAIVSLAFKSHEIAPMPAIPYGISQPRLLASAKVISRASQPQTPTVGSGLRVPAGFTPSPSPLSRQAEVLTPEPKPLPLPKLSVDNGQFPVPRDYSRPLGSPSNNSTVYGLDTIRHPVLQKPEPTHRESVSTMKSMSHLTSSHASQVYTGPDLRHYSMGSQSVVYETRDYLGLPPRPTGLFRMSTFAGVPKSAVAPSSSRSTQASRPSTESGISRGNGSC